MSAPQPRRIRALPAALTPVAVMVAVAAAVLVAGCASDHQAASGATEQIRVVASTDVYGSIVAAVGGERVQITSLIDNANADPLNYEATAADALAVSDAALVVFNGGGYDAFMPGLIEAAGGDMSVIDVVELSGLRSADDATFNEHVFYDMATMQALATRIAEVLTTSSPADADAFSANAKAFAAQIEGLRGQLGDIASTNSGARVAVTEPLPGYLIDEAGLDNVTPDDFAQAIEEGDDPSAAALDATLALFGADPVRVLVLNTQTQTAATDQIKLAAEDAEVPVVSMSETLTAADFVTWMDGQIKALTEALRER